MKKIIAICAALALTLAIGAAAYAASPETSLNSRGAGFVDADNDGVCDNRGSGSGAGFVDADNDGICDNRGSGSGAGFVDADNDGICDNRGSCNGARRGNA